MKLSFWQYLKAAFNARPFGMLLPPNWIGLALFGLLGLMNPGFWVIGAGLELGYLGVLVTNGRFQRAIAARQSAVSDDKWSGKIEERPLLVCEQGHALAWAHGPFQDECHA